MASETLVLDPTSEDSTNTQLTLTDSASGIDVLADPPPDYGNPERDRLFAGSADTFGDPLVQSRYRNRQITLTVRCYGTEAVMRARVRELTKKVGKIAQYGGTLKRTLNDATTITFDLLDADVSVPSDWMFLQRNSVTCTVTLLAKPAGRGASSTYSTSTETTNPEIVFAVAAPAGDLPALGKLEITDLSANDQQFVQWGVRCRNYSGSATNALSFAGTSRLALNSSTATAVTGAVSGILLQQNTITPTYAAMMGMASTGTAYPTHVGNYNVWARTYQGAANTAAVTMAFEWATGDLGVWTLNSAVTLGTATIGQFRHVDLGQVHLPAAVRGQQRWDGHVIVKSDDATATVGVDRVYLFPVDEGYGEARAINPTTSPSTFLARDEFNQAAGAATGKTLPVGGTWAGTVVFAPGTADFTVDATNHWLTRTGSTGIGRRALHNGTNYASVVLQADVNAVADVVGFVARFVDASNYFRVLIRSDAIEVVPFSPSGPLSAVASTGPNGTWLTYRIVIDTAGRWFIYRGARGGPLVLVLSGQHSSLATGGVLATGKAGPFDLGGTDPRYWDNFRIWTPATDGAPFASQSLEIGSSYAIREDSAGVAWGKVASYRGDYVRVPAANVGGTVQVIAKASRNDPDSSTDAGVDDVQAILTVIPQYLNVP